MATAPNASNYRLEGARVYITLEGDTGLVDLGNIVNPSISQNQQTQKHYTARNGTRVLDREEITSQEYNINFTLDEINTTNLSLAFRGSTATSLAQSSATVTSEAVTTLLNKAVRLQNRKVSAVTISTLVEGTDYVVDYELGAITALTSGAVGSKTVSYTAAAITGKQFTVGTHNGLQKLDKVVFVRQDSQGKTHEWAFDKATLATAGDTSINDQDWSTMGFTISAQRNGASALAPLGNYYIYSE